jgi:hypothetical protein
MIQKLEGEVKKIKNNNFKAELLAVLLSTLHPSSTDRPPTNNTTNNISLHIIC